MALDLPDHPPPQRDGPHPSVCLMLGFGVIVLGAIIVHVVFNALL